MRGARGAWMHAGKRGSRGTCARMGGTARRSSRRSGLPSRRRRRRLSGPALLLHVLDASTAIHELRRLRRLTAEERALLPPAAVNHIPVSRLGRRYERAEALDWGNGDQPGETRRAIARGDCLTLKLRDGAVPFVWVAFEANGKPVPRDSDEVVQQLGLCWGDPSDRVVRIDVPLGAVRAAGALLADAPQSPTLESWPHAVRAAPSGPELLAFLRRRLTPQSADGPPLDDRNGEGPEEVFERLAQDDDVFRLRLEETIAGYFKSPESSPADEAAKPLIRGLLETIPRLALTGTFSPLRAWLAQHKAALLTAPLLAIGRAALSALAGSQPTGLAEPRAFWLRLWIHGPEAWQPRAFIGLRLQDPEAAMSELPLLFQRTKALGQDPGPLLHGLWNQPSARPLLRAWLGDHENPLAREAWQALEQRIPGEIRPYVPRPVPRSAHLASPKADATRSQKRHLATGGGSDQWLSDRRQVA